MKSSLEQIKADTISIGELLSSDNRMGVPAYQRPYDWKRDEASDLLEDLRVAKDGGFDPFFGTIVVDVSDKSCYQIIDGQQRITTFNLLLIALRAVANKNGTKENVRLANKIHNVLTYENKTSGKATDSISRLDPSISIRDVYLPIVKDEDWNGQDYPSGNVRLKIRKIKPILDFFLDELSKLKHDEISQLLEVLYNGYVIILRITGKIQALEIFEHANVRGMELNAADLLKSYFVSSIEDQKDTELENRWIQIVSNSENVIRMIKHFGWTLFNKKVVVNRNQFYDSLKEYGTKHGEEKLLDAFDKFAQAYGIVESGDIEELVKWAGESEIAKEQKAYTFIRSLRGIRLFRIAQAYPLLAAALVNFKSYPSNTAANALVELADIIEKYHFINSYICQRRGNEVETLYAEKCKAIFSAGDELPVQINELKNKLKNQLADFKEFEPKFSEMSYETSAGVLKSIYYLFDRIENAERKGREVEEIYNPKLAVVKGDWEVEHILSQKPKTPHKDGSGDVIHSVGNLLVVPNGTNKDVGNKPVADKVPIYKKKIGRMASVMDFCEKYTNEAYGKFDSKEDVDMRTKYLAKIAYGKAFVISTDQASVLEEEALSS